MHHCDPGAWVVKVSGAREARDALMRPAVRGVIYPMPLTDPVLLAELEQYRVPKRAALGPFSLEENGAEQALATIREGLVRLGFAVDDLDARERFALEGLRVLEFFAALLGEAQMEYRFRFIPLAEQSSRPHYDYTALSLVRTLMGSGTWVYRPDGTRFQIEAFDLLILKGREFPARSEREALLHDYPGNDAPGATERGRVVMVVRTMRWPWAGADAA
jgi:hypothetical protein